MDAHGTQLLADLREAVLGADFGLQYANTVVQVNQDLENEALEALILRYRHHGEELDKTMHLVDTYNRVAAEEWANFREEAVDIVDTFLCELAAKEGWDYQPPPNPYRKDPESR
jgi:hypothetical protein